MKKFFAVIGLMVTTGVLFVNNSYADQTDPKQTQNVKVNVIFNPILSIAVNHQNVDLTFNTMEDYKNGVETNKADHLSVFSTDKTYAVKVKALDDKFIGDDKNFGIGNVSVEATDAAGSSGSVVPLATGEQTIYTGTKAGRDQKISVKYHAKGTDITNDEAINSEFIGKTFQATIVYTIAVN